MAKYYPLDVPGGFFHPVELPTPEGGTYIAGGLTLRDWFAGQALSGMIAATGREDRREEVDEITKSKVRSAYRYADAMLAERDRG